VNSEILDNIEIDENFEFFSRPVIFTTCMLFSPWIGGILYCINLSKSNQQNKIIGTYLTILFCNFFTAVPFFGFKMTIYSFDPIILIHHLLVALLIVLPLWNKHFEHLKYKTVLPISLLLIILVALCMSFILNLSILKQGLFLTYAVIIRLLYTIVKTKEKPIQSKS